MPEATFHTLRLRLLELGKDVSAFVDEVDPTKSSLSCRLILHDTPSLVAVVGTTPAHRERTIAHLAGIEQDGYAKTGVDSSYRYLHHVDHPPLRSRYPETTVFVQEESASLQKLSFFERRREFAQGDGKPEHEAWSAEGIVFVLDALDPWNTDFWQSFEQLCHPYTGRMIICVCQVAQLHRKDWPVLEKHLHEKLIELSGKTAPVVRLDYEDLFSLQSIRSYLENHAIGEQKWEALRELTQHFDAAFATIEDALKTAQTKQRSAIEMADALKEQLLALRETIWGVLHERIHQIGYTLDDQAGNILQKVRARLTTRAYLRSLAGADTSLNALQEGLETILCETISREVEAVHQKTSALIVEHARLYQQSHPSILEYCPRLQEVDLSSLPLPLPQQEIEQEVKKVLRELRLKSLVRDQIVSIDRQTTRQLRLSLGVLIIGAILGGMGWNLTGLGGVGAAVLICGFGLLRRQWALKQFFAFLRDWFLEVGTRIEEPIGGLTKGMINHSLDRYSARYLELLSHLDRQRTQLPEQQDRLRGFFFTYREMTRELGL